MTRIDAQASRGKTRLTVIFDEQRPTSFDLRFSIFHVPVRVHPFFWLVTVFMGWELIANGLEVLLLWVLCVFVSILLHELGHVWMGQIFGSRGHIVLQSFCGLAIGAGGQHQRWQRILVSLAGPGIQFLFVGLLLTVMYAIDQRDPDDIDDVRLMAEHARSTGKIDYFQAMVMQLFAVAKQPHWPKLAVFAVSFLFQINLYWALINLLPVWPLDGGRVSRELFLWHSASFGVRNSLALSLVTATVIVVNSISIYMNGPAIPYLPAGGKYFLVFFIWFAYENIVQLQYERARASGGWSNPGDDRMPWERDPDEWKRS
jgi:stage IV sporulation protein FB